jgi:hypothetical protein
VPLDDARRLLHDALAASEIEADAGGDMIIAKTKAVDAQEPVGC